ncbi:ATPase [Arthrobacter livingstonensis]|uniref:ATPase n=1 Tax=Arthrobacter livingstonensis TaxID=670078 RepID=A0A2V5LDI6_9MICC|nr:phage/plasmid primase, P4 family [Arthrobacter livingstonensis]PYI69745.1 ATPase [Arthrobacter livingstonensis]
MDAIENTDPSVSGHPSDAVSEADIMIAARQVLTSSRPVTHSEFDDYAASRWAGDGVAKCKTVSRRSGDGIEVTKAFASFENDSTADQSIVRRSPAGSFRPTGFETLVARTVTRYLAKIVDESDVELCDIRDGMLQRINAELSLENKGRKESNSTSPALKKIQVLDEFIVVQVLLARNRIVMIDLTDGNGGAENGVLAIYEDFGPLEGLYNDSESRIMALISELRPSLSHKGIESAFSRMRRHAQVLRRTIDPHLIPVANGVFDHAKMELRPFSSDWVFLSKVQVDYDSNATSPHFTTPDSSTWEIEAWMASLSDSEGVPELLWEIISAAVRPYEAWDKSGFLAGPKGNGGKGTVLALIRKLLGRGSYASVSLVDFGDRFKKSSLVRANVNLVDENDVGAFAESLGDWKACVTGDVFTLDRKYKDPVEVSWQGFEVQCFNTMTPRMKDKSESLKRRLLIVPMVKSFKGVENKDIKRDYLQRDEVLRYVLKRALHMRHTELSNPPACEDALEEWFGTNNKVVGFWREFEDQFQWDLLPWAFLYDLYKEWFSKVEPSGKTEGYKPFIEALKSHLDDSQVWTTPDKSVRPGQHMDAVEPLIAEFDLRGWVNQSYTGNDPVKKCMPAPLKDNYRGLLRTSAGSGASGPSLVAAGAAEEQS